MRLIHATSGGRGYPRPILAMVPAIPMGENLEHILLQNVQILGDSGAKYAPDSRPLGWPAPWPEMVAGTLGYRRWRVLIARWFHILFNTIRSPYAHQNHSKVQNSPRSGSILSSPGSILAQIWAIFLPFWPPPVGFIIKHQNHGFWTPKCTQNGAIGMPVGRPERCKRPRDADFHAWENEIFHIRDLISHKRHHTDGICEP